jgi:hypothetical protein
MRNRSRFALKIITVDGPVAHNKELRVQAGGLLGLQNLTQLASQVDSQNPETVFNIHKIVAASIVKYGNIEDIPYSNIIKDIAAYKVRQKSHSKSRRR